MSMHTKPMRSAVPNAAPLASQMERGIAIVAAMQVAPTRLCRPGLPLPQRCRVTTKKMTTKRNPAAIAMVIRFLEDFPLRPRTQRATVARGTAIMRAA